MMIRRTNPTADVCIHMEQFISSITGNQTPDIGKGFLCGEKFDPAKAAELIWENASDGTEISDQNISDALEVFYNDFYGNAQVKIILRFGKDKVRVKQWKKSPKGHRCVAELIFKEICRLNKPAELVEDIPKLSEHFALSFPLKDCSLETPEDQHPSC